MTNFDLERQIRQKLADKGIDSPRFEARQIVIFASTSDEAMKMAEKRLTGYPLQYILGEWEFYGKRILVGDGVLIPRADTETLVDAVAKVCKLERPEIFDLCAGSGCIGIALGSLLGGSVTFFEKSEQAIEYLEKNIEINCTDGEIVKSDVFTLDLTDYENTADIIVSNPPYIKTDVLPSLQAEVKFEPQMALDGGDDGLHFYREIAKKWKPVLKKGGILAFEIGFDQRQEVENILKTNGYNEIAAISDLGGNDRVVMAVKP